MVNWLLARQRGWQIILRVEDLDGPRIKRGADRQAMEDLQWLGLDWDQGPIYQSTRMNQYAKAVQLLLNASLAYACVCSRKEVEAAASAPHTEDGLAVYPGTCRNRFKSQEAARVETGRPPAIRFAVPDELLAFNDCFAGRQQFDVAKQLGDFVIAKADATPAYQLAVVSDDAGMGVTDIVRGDDLLDSTPRQILLYRALGLTAMIPNYFHLPLVVGPDGLRLAKRHGDTRLSFYRDRGVPPERVLALLARWCGMDAPGNGIRASDLLGAFKIERLPRERIVFSAEDDAWLREGAIL
jgi:glutamyl-tRNA synthetase